MSHITLHYWNIENHWIVLVLNQSKRQNLTAAATKNSYIKRKYNGVLGLT